MSPAIVNDINWEMTPEEAVTLYLEWGNNWTHGKHLVRSKKDVSLYFVVNTWDAPPVVYLIRRNSDEAVELGKIEIPAPLSSRFLEQVAHRKGVYAISPEIRAWLEEALQGPSAPKSL
ncbi:MAG: hypothetical protein JXL84_21120 [Deltaproteobacteria bacterium]|nr:hypothetical protein [Deltaproteobacteria bacterium]